jgi:hypothetical protein
LILTLANPHRASYYDDWRDAFVDNPDFDSRLLNILSQRPSDLAHDIDSYDAVIPLHSCNNDALDYITPLADVLARRRRAKLLSFLGVTPDQLQWKDVPPLGPGVKLALIEGPMNEAVPFIVRIKFPAGPRFRLPGIQRLNMSR